ncbi:MAG TPA: hypothetical protein VH186_23065 [Chloroflexia bacterium]|nr:hypothetical protein [Chloroflexia bacterium]
MSFYDTGDDLVIKGQVQRGYTFSTSPDVCFEYLSDIRNLLGQVPYVSKIQVGKNSGRARAFFSFNILNTPLKAVLDLEPIKDKEQNFIRLQPAREPLGPLPSGYYTATFQANIRIQPVDQNRAHVNSHIMLAFDGLKLVERGLFPRFLLETTGPALFQEYCERLCDEYALNLLEHFKQWQTERSLSDR